MLKLRAVRANGDFDTYWTWHEQQEFICTHQARYRDQLILTCPSLILTLMASRAEPDRHGRAAGSAIRPSLPSPWL